MRRFWTLPIAGLMMLGLTACPSYTMMHTAKPIAPGSIEIGIIAEAAGYGITDTDVGGVTVEGDSVIAPGIEFQLRYGINDSSDFGVKYSTTQPLSLILDYNFAFINTGTFALSIDPTITPMYFSAGDGSVFTVTTLLPIMADVVSSDSMALTVSVIPGLWYGSVSGAVDDTGLSVDGIAFAIGGSIGLKLYLGESFALMPAFTFLYWLPTEENAATFYTWTGGLGFLF